MSNSFYNHSTYPTPNAPGSSANMRAELDLITAGFNKLPTLAGNGYKVAMINAAGTALIASSALQQLALTQSTIDSTPIGGTTRAAGAFTTLSANSTVNLGSAVTISGGVIDNTVIGGTTPAAGSFTTLAASSITGNLTGNVTGNLTGNVTGNVTGDVTGNVTASSGTSSFNNVTINGTLDMNAGSVGTITGLATPTNSSDAAPKSYVDTQRDTRLALAGGTMSGAIAMGTNRITGLGDPSSTQDAATKNYTDTQNALKLSLAGGTMSGAIAMGTNRITGLGDPVGNQDAATKNYVDSVAQGLDVKPSVRAATTENITLSGTATIDGVALIAGDRVLVKDQTTASQNGIYVVAAGGWGRASDMDAWAELPGAFVFVEDGSTNDNSGWVCTVAPGGTIGTTAVTFEQFSGAGQITAGNGLTKSGNTLNVGTASTARIVVNADNIDLATTGVTAGTYRSVTVDGYGRVTAGTNPTTLAGYGITDAYTSTQVDTALALKLNLSGGTMSGNIAMGNNRITGLPTPSATGEAATKGYVDTADALKLNLSGGTMSGAIAMGTNKITGLGDPTSAQDAVTLNYVTTLYGSTASAAASASAAATSATNASNSASAASSSASAAAASASAAAASYDSFDDRYLGPKSSDPTVDNDGNALLTGALYWNTSLNQMKVYSGSAWLISYVPSDFYLPLAGGTMTGNITLDAGTANGVAYLNGSKVLTTGSALTFDGATVSSPVVQSTNGTITTVLSYSGGNSTGVVGTTSNHSLEFRQNNTEQMRLTSTGLGIGTSSPSGKLNVAGYTSANSDSEFQITRTSSSTGVGQGPGIRFNDGTTNNTRIIQNSSGNLQFWHYNGSWQTEMILNSSGNLGIGTSSPATRLHVTTGATGAQALFSHTSGTPTIAVGNSTTTYNTQIGYNVGSEYGYIQAVAAAGVYDDIAINPLGGNVGIGTSSPAAKLNVSGGAIRLSDGYEIGWGDNSAYIVGNGASDTLQFITASSEQMRLTSTGLGIGTSSVGYALSVNGAGQFVSTSSTSGGLILGTSIGSIDWRIADGGVGGGYALTFGSISGGVTTTRMTLDAVGNLGLGVTPSAWASFTGLQVGALGGLSIAGAVDDSFIGSNVYYNAGFKFAAASAAYATAYRQSSGQHRWLISTATGTAGNTATMTQAMTLDASGRLALGVTSALASSLLTVAQNTNNDVALSVFNTNTGADAAARINIGNNDYNNNEITIAAYSATATGTQFGISKAKLKVIFDNSVTSATNGLAIGTSGANPLYFATSDTERMRIDSSGNVSIGSTSAGEKLDVRGSIVAGTGTSGKVYINGSGGTGACTFEILGGGSGNPAWDIGTYSAPNTLTFGYTLSGSRTERARITSGGYFKASDNGTYVNSTGTYHELNQSANSTAAYIYASNASFTAEVLQIRAARNTTNNTFYAINYYNEGAAAYKWRVADSGNVTNTNGSYGTISDAKMKTDIVDAGSQWADIKAIRFRKFKMKDDPEQVVQLGVVAQEIEQTSPGLVEEHKDIDKDGNDLGTTTKSVKTSVLLMKAAVALQEAMARIEQLEAKVAALESK